MTADRQHCDEHSGCLSDISHLKEFERRQSEPEKGINDQLWEAIRQLRECVAVYTGGLRLAAWIVPILLMIAFAVFGWRQEALKQSIEQLHQINHGHAVALGRCPIPNVEEGKQ